MKETQNDLQFLIELSTTIDIPKQLLEQATECFKFITDMFGKWAIIDRDCIFVQGQIDGIKCDYVKMSFDPFEFEYETYKKNVLNVSKIKSKFDLHKDQLKSSLNEFFQIYDKCESMMDDFINNSTYEYK